MLWVYVLPLLLFVTGIKAGHEIVDNYRAKNDDLQPHELLIFQYDSRPPVTDNDYWKAAAVINQLYAEKHHHQYAYLSMEGPCKYATFTLSDVWCKVKAMVEIHDLFPTARAYLYIDSDAIITTDYSMTNVIGYIQQDLHWNITQKPIAFNQDGPGWSCTIFWYNLHDITRSIFSEWLNSASDSYDTSLFPSKWRTKWPYEQAQMYKIYDMYEDKIIRLSFPDRAYLPWTSYKNPKAQYPTDKVEPWCFCHMPGANCFISHHCASVRQKKRIIQILANMTAFGEAPKALNGIHVHVVYIKPCSL